MKPEEKARRDINQRLEVETFFIDVRDPEPRSRRLFAFHRPETLAEWASDATVGAGLVPVLGAGTSPAPTLRARLRELPSLITTGLWPAQEV